MAKDPSVLFYTNDFLTGTTHFTREEKGLYIELLCHQQQKGPLSLEFIKRISGPDFEKLWGIVSEKFAKDADGNFFNKRMKDEVDKRKRFSEKQKENVEKRWNKIGKAKALPKKKVGNTTVLPLENENENRNEIVNEVKEEKRGVGRKEGSVLEEFKELYNSFIKHKTGVPPKWDGVQVKAAQSIISHIRTFDKVVTDQDILNSWKYILKHWHNLDQYLGNKLKLSEINSDITNICNQIKNPKPKINGQKTNEQRQQEYAELDSLANQYLAIKNGK